MGFLHGMARRGQVIEGQLDIRVVDSSLENLAIRRKESGPAWFGLLQPQADGQFKDITLYRAVDSREEAKLPLRTGMTGFLRKPDI